VTRRAALALPIIAMPTLAQQPAPGRFESIARFNTPAARWDKADQTVLWMLIRSKREVVAQRLIVA
jgi:hypothetical protein